MILVSKFFSCFFQQDARSAIQNINMSGISLCSLIPQCNIIAVNDADSLRPYHTTLVPAAGAIVLRSWRRPCYSCYIARPLGGEAYSC